MQTEDAKKVTEELSDEFVKNFAGLIKGMIDRGFGRPYAKKPTTDDRTSKENVRGFKQTLYGLLISNYRTRKMSDRLIYESAHALRVQMADTHPITDAEFNDVINEYPNVRRYINMYSDIGRVYIDVEEPGVLEILVESVLNATKANGE